MAGAIGQALGIRFSSNGKRVEQLCDYLRTKRLLLLLDNAEHLRSGVAAIQKILLRAPQVKILVTSRVRLAVDAEWVLELGGLELPRESVDLDHSDASVLFLQQARQAQMTFEPSDEDRDAIVRICSHLSGLPLAIVLATRQLRDTSCADLATALANNIDYLSSTIRNLPRRHRSLWDNFQYSWSLLSHIEQQVLLRLAVFKGDFSVEAARSVTMIAPHWITKLVHASLVVPTAPGRFKIHELAQAYVAGLLYTRPEEEAHMRARHAAYFVGLFAQQVAILSETPHASEAIGADYANVCAALDWVEHFIHDDRVELPHDDIGVQARQVAGEVTVAHAATQLPAMSEAARGMSLARPAAFG